jgi:RNA polymerase sigma-70 factor (ECF subfamily)
MRVLSTAGGAGAGAAGHESGRLAHRLEEHRGALTAHCRRILGSGFEADDAVQETLVRAWRAFDDFEGRASLWSWLRRIATNVCLDMLRAPQRRARPVDLASPPRADSPADATPPAAGWMQPLPGGHASGPAEDPAEQAVEREAVRQAVVASLLRLPPRQHAVLILREVLRWNASEVAELLDTTVASVNSALQRARWNLAAGHAGDDRSYPEDDAQRPLLQRYVDAFEGYDLDSLVALLQQAVPASAAVR